MGVFNLLAVGGELRLGHARAGRVGEQRYDPGRLLGLGNLKVRRQHPVEDPANLRR
jgi:hypothetical protein